jgi:hypothetical protein
MVMKGVARVIQSAMSVHNFRKPHFYTFGNALSHEHDVGG